MFAVWQEAAAQTYTVTYDANGATSGTAPTDSSSPYMAGATVTVLGDNGLKKDGFTFGGWSYNGNVYGKDGTFTMPANDVTLTAIWTPIPKYTVTYDANGATSGTAPTDSSSPYMAGATVTVLGDNGLKKDGFTFGGWSYNGNVYGKDGTFTMPANDVTLTAIWKAEPTPGDTYKVTYYGNGNTGGTAPVDNNSYSYNDIATVASKGNLVKAGFTFVEWNTDPHRNGTSYSERNKITITDNVTLYAIWKAEPTPGDTYKVTYDGNGNTGGTAPTDNTNYNGGETVTVKDKNTLEKTGSTFKEWNTQPNGNGTSYKPGDTFIMPTSNVTLYAIWTTDSVNSEPTDDDTISTPKDDDTISTPKTGENNFNIMMAANICILSISAAAMVTMQVLRRRKKIQSIKNLFKA